MRFHLANVLGDYDKWRVCVGIYCIWPRNNRNQHFVSVLLRSHLNRLFGWSETTDEHGRNGQFCIYFTLDEVKTKKSTNTNARTHTHTHHTYIKHILYDSQQLCICRSHHSYTLYCYVFH